MTIFREEATSALVFMGVLYLARIGIWKLFFVAGGKPENPEKNLRAELGNNQQQTQPTYAPGRNRT